MQIALIGYGKMGKEVERIASERGHTIAVRLTSTSPPPSEETVRGIDVAIHFATPATVVPHVEAWAAQRKHLVIGTTGWQEQIETIRALVEKHQIGLVFASNFSLGMNAFLYIVRQAGAMFNTLPEYDLFLHEEHHKDKTDSPSGTALALARILLQTIQRKNEVLNGIPEGKIRPEQLHVTSTRGGTIVGMHRVVFDSAADQIELVHTAKNRSGFAHGALLAAEWVRGKRGMFTMEDVIEDLLQKGEKRER